MFTGLIEQQGEVLLNHCGDVSNRLLIRSPFDEVLQPGESIAVNGVCLTYVPDPSEHLAFDISPETLKLSTLGTLMIGNSVNIERALLASSRLGGHYVSGHVDTSACLMSLTPVGDYIEMAVGDFLTPAEAYLLPKGSITLNGVSLTINEVVEGCIKVMLVPHTLAVTTLGQLQVGERMNVEFDYLTRLVVHQLELMRLNK